MLSNIKERLGGLFTQKTFGILIAVAIIISACVYVYKTYVEPYIYA